MSSQDQRAAETEAQYMTDVQARRRFQAIADGSKVIVEAVHKRDTDNTRTIKGKLEHRNDDFVVRRSATSYVVFPNDDFKIIYILVDRGSRSASERRDTEGSAVNADGGVLEQPRRVQPAADLNDKTHDLYEMFVRQQESFTKMTEALMKSMGSNSNQQQRSDQQTDPQSATNPGMDVTRLMELRHAQLTGEDRPMWQLAEGLHLPKSIASKFMIVSIPHLLHKIDPITKRMVRKPMGSVLPEYLSILASCKMEFPGIAAVAPTPTSSRGKDAMTEHDSSEGMRAEIARNEETFKQLLAQLDASATLPETVEQWIPFINVGVSLLASYATLAYGFKKGGAHVSLSFQQQYQIKGTFDPMKLWPVKSSFRRNE